jgi:hypothetical protein
MTEHTAHMIHDNSIEAFHTLDRHTRKLMVLACYERADRPLTDREVCKMLGFSDPNSVRPRTTEAIQSGDLVECGKVKENGRTVRLCKPRPQYSFVNGQRSFC